MSGKSDYFFFFILNYTFKVFGNYFINCFKINLELFKVLLFSYIKRKITHSNEYLKNCFQ